MRLPRLSFLLLLAGWLLMLRTNREFRDHLAKLDIDQQFVELLGVGHNMMQIMSAMGPEFWRFYGETLAGADGVFADGFGAARPCEAGLQRRQLSATQSAPQPRPGGVRPARP